MPWPKKSQPTATPSVATVARSARQIESEPFAPRAREWRSDVFDHIEWRRFEALCEALYRQAGVRTESQSHGADGGIDVWLYLQNSDKPMLVQCKHQTALVGVEKVRALAGKLHMHKLARAIFATSSDFTPEALAEARASGISAQNRQGLLKLIGTRTPEQQAALLGVAYEGDYWRPTCASCGVKMVVRQAKDTGGMFWGCVNFAKTRCMSKIQLRSAAK